MDCIGFRRLLFGGKEVLRNCIPKAGEVTAQLIEASKSVYTVS